MNMNRIESLKVKQMAIIVQMASGLGRSQVSNERGVTLSAITLSVQKAEDTLGIKIFVRSKKGWMTRELTPEGQDIVAKFKQVLAILSGKPVPSGNVTEIRDCNHMVVSFGSDADRHAALVAGQCRYTLFGEPV